MDTKIIPYTQETHFRSRDTHRLKVRRSENVSYANGNQKKTGVAIFTSDKKRL